MAVVHGSPPLRDGLGELLERQSDLRVLRLYASAGDVLEHLPDSEHVLLYDLATAQGRVSQSEAAARLPAQREDADVQRH